MWITRIIIIGAASLFLNTRLVTGQEHERMDQLWGEQESAVVGSDSVRGELFRNGNYAMFIHWGLYSNIANRYQGKTYYGISEWIMSSSRANIPVEEYKRLAKDFNPVDFNAEAIVQLAKKAGMKYIIITSKHHDGFAMYDSDVSDFNIVDATPFGRDPMKELAAACKKENIGFGFYYSQNQDWTAPGGGRGPVTNDSGDTVTFNEYFYNKCIPQVDEITTRYGDMVLIWFDTPGRIPEKYARELVDLVHRNQSKALVSGRVGHGLGDYRTLGDMEIPHVNVEGPWESVDVTNDSWGYAWYDENWKSPKEILERLISTVARGGTYMLNVGPDGKGNIPGFAARSLESSGKWLSAYPQVVYGAGPSPWLHALPWGDVTVNGDQLYLSIYEYPRNGKLYLPGLKNDIVSAKLLNAADLTYSGEYGDLILDLPFQQPEEFISVIELTIDGVPLVDHTPALDPFITTELTTHFAETVQCKIEHKRWMEKFGEWKGQQVIRDWKEGSKATWEIKVFQPGVYFVELSYAGSGRLAWSVTSNEGAFVQNQQNSSHIYSTYPMGWMQFEKPGIHKVSVSLVEGSPETSELSGIRFTPISFGSR